MRHGKESFMKPCVFTGSAVAIVTPFCGDGVDLEAFDRRDAELQ